MIDSVNVYLEVLINEHDSISFHRVGFIFKGEDGIFCKGESMPILEKCLGRSCNDVDFTTILNKIILKYSEYVEVIRKKTDALHGKLDPLDINYETEKKLLDLMVETIKLEAELIRVKNDIDLIHSELDEARSVVYGNLLDIQKKQTIALIELVSCVNRLQSKLINVASVYDDRTVSDNVHRLTMTMIFITVPMLVFSFFGMNFNYSYFYENGISSIVFVIIISLFLIICARFILAVTEKLQKKRHMAYGGVQVNNGSMEPYDKN